jgi:hypothetical protein
MSREAMQIALDALEANLGNWAAKTKAVEVLRQALETEKQWVGLTDKDIDDCYFAARTPDFDLWAFAAEIDDLLREKNKW